MSTFVRSFVALACGFVCARGALCQEHATIRGVVRDDRHQPLSRADVSIASQHLLVQTNDSGVFTFSAVKVGSVDIMARRLGYSPNVVARVVQAGATDTLTIELQTHPYELPGVDAQVMRRRAIDVEDFYRRRARGMGGTFITRDQILQRDAVALTDVLRDVNGVRLMRTGNGQYSLRFPTTSINPHDCPPEYWVDGQHVLNAEPDLFPARDIEGIEVYSGMSTVPMQFSKGVNASCGTIVLWTRIPGSDSK